ncbi:MAG: PD40 domain-containing protein [Vicinamibacteria bacterium]|nr:PD40 domain-containing protein [Vicinamibacteria bacterium]
MIPDAAPIRSADGVPPSPARRRRARWLIAGALLAVSITIAFVFSFRERSLPSELHGTIVYVSDRAGVDALYEHSLETGKERALTHMTEPVRSPAIAPDRRRVAFEMGGRIGVLDRSTGETRMLTLGVKWKDGAPAWHPRGDAIVIASRRDEYAKSDLHLLAFGESSSPVDVTRAPLVQTPGLNETSPIFSPDGRFIVFIRDDNVYRIPADDAGRPSRLTHGFKKWRAPRCLRDGRLVVPWSLEKIHGIDRMDADGRNRVTLYEGSIFYAGLSPSPNGAHFAATFSYDLAFHPMQALRLRKGEEIHLLRFDGGHAGVLARSSRHANHSPDWMHGR